MGSCGSKQKEFIGMRSFRKKKHQPGSKSVTHMFNKIEPSASKNLSCSKTSSKDNDTEFYPEVMTKSDSDKDFYSRQYGNSSESFNIVSHCICVFCDNISNTVLVPPEKHEQSSGLEPNAFKEGSIKEKSTTDPQLKSNNAVKKMKGPGHIDKMSSRCMDTNAARAAGIRHEKRKPSIPSSPGTRWKSSLTKILSFKQREGCSNSALSRCRLNCPILGHLLIQILLKVRGEKYFRDKKKEFAPNYAAFYPFGFDVFLSPRKIDHIARFVELPTFGLNGVVPPILLVNIQIPLYPPTIFQNEHNGEGMSFVFYFKLSENYSKELPVHFQESIQKLIHAETEKIKGFSVNKYVPFRDRLKFLGRVVNVEELHLSAAEKRLMNAYNEKSVLSHPQHEFYLGKNYFEIDMDIHRFSYIARKGLESFKDTLKKFTLDFGLTIQGNKAEELPEHMLCCIRLKEIDYTNYQ